MMNYQSLYDLVKERFIKADKLERFNHSVRVIQMALKLKKIHKLEVDDEHIKIAGLFHDYAKTLHKDVLEKQVRKNYPDDSNMLKAPLTWHSFIGANLVKDELKIIDEKILDAIYYHTTGKKAMNPLTKLIYIADYVEEGRTYDSCVNARQIAYQDLDDTVYFITKNTIQHLNEQKLFIHPLTIETYQYYQNKENNMLDKVLKILSKAVVNDIIVYEMKEITPYYDYSIVCSVNSNRQGAATINYLKKDMSELGYEIRSFSTSSESNWFLIDLNDIVVHVFVGDERKRYNLDGMYNHLPKQIINE